MTFAFPDQGTEACAVHMLFIYLFIWGVLPYWLEIIPQK